MLVALYSDTVAVGNSGKIVVSLDLNLDSYPQIKKPILTTSFVHIKSDSMRFESKIA